MHPISVGENYSGDSVEIPVTIINGEHGGPTAFFTAAIHGDELNGVKVVQEIADRHSPQELHGTLVCLHVCNTPAYEAKQRYTPVYDQLCRGVPVHWPGGYKTTSADSEKRWLRADTCGLVEMQWGPYPSYARENRSDRSRTTLKTKNTSSLPRSRAYHRISRKSRRGTGASALSSRSNRTGDA